MQLASEVFGLPAVKCSFQKEPDNGCMAHFFKTPIRAENSAADNPKSTALELLCELIVLCIKRLLVKSAELVEFLFIHQHKHAGCKRAVKTGESLHQVVAAIQQLVHQAPLPTQYVRRDTVQRF